jgi:hypothetical protein
MMSPIRACSGFDPLPPLHRRDFLGTFATGLAGVGLASLLGHDRLLADGPRPNHPARAKRAVQIFLQGGLSQVDSFDYKPELIKQHGKPMPAKERPDVFFKKVGLLTRPHFPFRQRGKSGLWVSDLFPELARVADELTVLRSLVAGTGNHTPATFQAHSGWREPGFPSMGAWLSYGLGSLADNLPTFVVLPDVRGLPTGGANMWSNAFLPARHQGVVFNARGPAIHDLHPPQPLDERTRKARHALLEEMNARHLEAHGGADELSGRMRSYELAARMQLAVPEVADLARETKATHALYGTDRKECADFARACLLARRLLEKGVRLVQLWSGGPFGGPTWDAHDSVPKNHTTEARRIDRPVAALLRDLRARGMLDDTLVIFNTEFGRTPFAQAADGKVGAGRDHNQTAASGWLAGAGLKAGTAFGETDPFGYKAVGRPIPTADFHATLLHLLGIDHKELTFYHNGIRRRLTNVQGEVVKEILA